MELIAKFENGTKILKHGQFGLYHYLPDGIGEYRAITDKEAIRLIQEEFQIHELI